MNLLSSRFNASPVAVRVLPFFLFLGLTAIQSLFGPGGQFWIYLLKTLIGARLIWEVRAFIPEMQWKFSLSAVLAGIFVFVMWVGLQDFLRTVGINPKFAVIESSGPSWNPRDFFGSASPLAWFFVVVRI